MKDIGFPFHQAEPEQNQAIQEIHDTNRYICALIEEYARIEEVRQNCNIAKYQNRLSVILNDVDSEIENERNKLCEYPVEYLEG